MGELSKLAKYLNQHISGNVFDRPSICAEYSTDRSILEATPRLVAFPENTDDVRRLVLFSDQLALRSFRLPLTMRGTGIDKTGAAITEGMIISTERMDQIEEVDLRGRLIRVQPGITLGALNAALGLQGLCLPIDYDPRSTIGGLIANCPNDDASDRRGGIFQYIERAEVVLASGEIVQFAPYHFRNIMAKIESGSPEGELYRRIEKILDDYGDTIVNRSMRPFDAAGYANITRIKHGNYLSLLPLLFASQGTLGLVTDVILRVEVVRPPTRRLATVIHDQKTLLRFMNEVNELNPHTLRLYDLRILDTAALYGNWPDLLRHDEGDGWLVIVSFNDRRYRTERKLQRCRESLNPNEVIVIETPENSADFEEFDSALLSFLNDGLDGERTPIVDDVYIPHYKLEDYFAGLKTLEMTLGINLPVFGSYATSNYNIRPEIDCTSMDGRRQIVSFLRHYSRLVQSCDGSLTGGSPEGRVKTLSTAQSFTDEERELYNAIKDAFDPHHILNPDVKMGAELKSTIRHLRTTLKRGIATP